VVKTNDHVPVIDNPDGVKEVANTMYTFAYTLGSLFYLPIWVLIFFIRKDLRKQMNLVGLYVGTGAIFTDYFWSLNDYWHPLKYIGNVNFFSQDLAFGFIFGGVSSVSYDFLFRKQIEPFTINANRIILISLSYFLPFYFFTTLAGINSIYSNISGLLFSLAIVLFIRTDLIGNALIGGLFTLLSAVLLYSMYLLVFPDFFNDWWLLQNLSGFFVLKIPFEEILWFMAFGMVIGPVYKFLHTR
jgi:Lycopene cyclase